ncbi:DNA/RNA polymerase [Armillaria solidipes]|uniref:DNA polymerase kappa n=1 Tax=Armillaria solidipes TaxID=1076256 RepID=A0A2H3BSK9_9AGAR|nr:DNA/RNA polymerase [Armillaria solidipes]
MTSEPPPKSSQATESLVKRLAGPSTGKAGLVADQTEINRVITEASKGSKFYENEKRKDQDLTNRINKILKMRDEVTKGVDMHKVESTVDGLVREVERQRDLSQTIVHVDMDAFYANVELLFNPDLKGKPFGVGHGVLTTASYEARKYGVRSGMPGFIAKKLCPELILVKLNFTRYSEMSRKVMDIFERYDPNMCAAGCDEGYLNITSYCEEHDMTPDDCVQEMRRKVFEETNLTVSAGIAPNKMLAKICSDKNKPNGQFHLPFDSHEIITFMHDLSIRKVPGIGRVNERLLESVGIKTCGDIYTHRAMLSLMDKQFGLHFLLRTHLGIASNNVQPHQREERKSIGAERTFNPLDNKERIFQKLQEVAQELEDDMNSNGWTGRTITLKFKLDTYQVFTRAKSFDRWIMKKEELFKIGKELLLPEFPLKLRLIGLRVTKLKDIRAASDTTAGIKRFFEPVGGDQSTSNKRPKTEHDNDQPLNSLKAQDQWDDEMPGFHELDDTDNDMNANEGDLDENVEPLFRSRPPVSEPARSSQDPVRISIKPRSSITRPSSSSSTAKVPQDCPICGKTLTTDNKGFNDHIDFCLSRGIISQVQAEASVGTSSKPKQKLNGKRRR